MAISIDFETYLIGEPDNIPKPVCLAIYEASKSEDGTGTKTIVTGLENIETSLSEILKEDLVIAHNARFECLVIYEWFPKLRAPLIKALRESRIYCTLIAEKLVNNLRKKQIQQMSLADLVGQYFQEDISAGKEEDAWRYRYSELDGVPLSEWPREAVDYALSDALWAYRIWTLQKAVAPRYGLSVRSEVTLNLMALQGLRVSKERLQICEQEVKDKLGPIYKSLISRGLCDPPIGNHKPKKNMNEFRQWVKDNIPNPEKTAKGNVATGRESLIRYKTYMESLNAPEAVVLDEFLTISEFEKVQTAFISRLKEADPYIYTDYNSVVSTGRTSSRTSKFYPSVNIQQMPRKVEGVTHDIRNCFVPREGYKIVAIDYAGLELAATAHQLGEYYGESAMRDALNRGEGPTDMHSMFAARIMGIKERRPISYEDFVLRKKEPEYAKYRQLSKPINLGFPGGIGYDTMRKLLAKEGIRPGFEVVRKSYSKEYIVKLYKRYVQYEESIRVARLSKNEYGLAYDELVSLKQELFNLYPELGHFLKEGHKDFLTGKTKNMKNDFGEWEEEPMYRYSTHGFSRDWCTYTALCNGYLMQTPSAIGAKTMLTMFVEKYLEDERVIPLAFIHDEIVFEVLQNGEQEDIIKDVSELMIDAMQMTLNSVRITVEASMMDYWDKGGGDYQVMYWKDPKDWRLKS